MKHIFTLAGPYLGAALLVATGFSAYGCADSVSVDPDPDLASLEVLSATLEPSFNSATTQYRVEISSSTTSVIVRATKSEPSDVLSGSVNAPAGQTVGQATIQAPGQGSTKDLTITVSASDGRAKTYTITLVRAALGGDATLRSLTVSTGSLTPAFSPNTRIYTVNAGSNDESILVTATKTDPNAEMSDDVVAAPGTATGQATIQLGAQGTATVTVVLINVLAPNGNSQTYRITVTRPAPPPPPPAPTIAPDLISADDSCPLDTNDADGDGDTNECFPGTSNEDNITNVTTPRFRIAPPATGESPNLYVNGNPVSTTFDSLTNTLRPTAVLSDASYAITYTVTNAGGESPQSPHLTITIDSTAP
jgi:hypothetical protein